MTEERRESKPGDEFKPTPDRTRWVVPIAVALIGLAGVVVAGGSNDPNPAAPTPSREQAAVGASATSARPSPSAEPTGRIQSPASGDKVERDIVARGILTDIPEDQHVWLVVRDGNLLYPQASEVAPPDGPWSLRFRQGGATPVISLELYRMGDDAHAFITDRLDRKNYSGISRIPGATRLDVVGDLQFRD